MANQAIDRSTIDKLIADSIGPLAAQQARDLWISQKMQDLPETYRSLLVANSDRNVLAAAEQQIRTQYRADMKTEVPKHVAAGHYVGNDPPQNVLDYRAKVNAAQVALNKGDVATAHQLLSDAQQSSAAQEPPPDLSKMSPDEKILYAMGGGGKGNVATGGDRSAGQGMAGTQAGLRMVGQNLTADQKIAMGLMQKGGF